MTLKDSTVWETVTQDVLYTLRGLRNAPGYAATLLLTLALGLGAITTLVSIVDSVLVEPVRVNSPEQLFVLSLTDPQIGNSHELDAEQIVSLREYAHSFSAISAYNLRPQPVDTGEGARTVFATQVTPELFQNLGLRMKYGRTMTPRDVNAPVAIVSNAFWREQVHGNPKAVGSRIKVNGRVRTIVGVLSEGTHFPNGTDLITLYTPMDLQHKSGVASVSDSGMVLARLKPEVSQQRAMAEASSVLKFSRTESSAGKTILKMDPYVRYLVGDDLHLTLLAMLGGGCVLLLIACANAANIQIARAAGRIGEFHVRAALGASSKRILGQLITESVVTSLVGAVIGGVVAYGLVAAIRGAYGAEFARFDELAVHPAAALTCALIAIVVGILASLAPLRLLQQSGSAATARVTKHSRVPRVLVTVQVALTCVLLATGGLFLRTLHALEDTKLGFDPHHVTVIVLAPLDQQTPPEVSRQTLTRLLDGIAVIPGVQSVTTQTSLPFSNYDVVLNSGIDVRGRPYNKDDKAFFSMVGSNFVEASNIQLTRGRGFLPQDDSSKAMVGLVNEAFAKKFLSGREPIGATVKFHRNPEDKDSDMPLLDAITTVGVVENELQGGQLGAHFQPMVYLNYRQIPTGSPLTETFGLFLEIAVRSSLPQAVLTPTLRTVMKQLAPNMTELKMGSLERAVEDSLSQRRLALRLLSGFGSVALVLTAIGLYGVLASLVAQRRSEIGIRMALGSSPSGVTWLIARRAGTMVVLGLVVGIVGAWPATQAVRSFLFGVKAWDPYALGGAVVLMILVSGIATIVPALRAARIDPCDTLRRE